MTVLPVPPLGEKTVTTRPSGAGRGRARGEARLADGEDDVVGELRKQQDVGDVRIQRGVE